MKLIFISAIIFFVGAASQALDETPLESLENPPLESEDRFGIYTKINCTYACPFINKPVCGIQIKTFRSQCEMNRTNRCEKADYFPIPCVLLSLMKKVITAVILKEN